MTPTERQARELLAAEYERGNWPNEARHIRENRLEAVEQFALRAIATALRMGGERECATCEYDGVHATDGAGPYDCYACGKKAKPEAVGEGGCACGNCGASSDYASTDVVAEAVAAWNRRFTDAGMPELPASLDTVRGMVRGERDWVEPCDDYYTASQMHAYARDYAAANVAQATEALRAEVEALQFQCDRIHCEKVKALLRAERLAEALRDARDYVANELGDERVKFAGYEHCSRIASIEADLAKIDNALHPQEADNG